MRRAAAAGDDEAVDALAAGDAEAGGDVASADGGAAGAVVCGAGTVDGVDPDEQATTTTPTTTAVKIRNIAGRDMGAMVPAVASAVWRETCRLPHNGRLPFLARRRGAR
jgi:hypothetical protein